MKIKRIILKNIRSYENQEVVFAEGSTLLSGDIGSGKTSILLAIEFALFGLQPGQKGSALLRNNSNEGGVSLEFEIEGNEILIERTIKRGSKSISQDYAAITIAGEKRELSVTELKNKILELINYPKEFSKKQNILYKFTVYTPQEEMKQIILEDAETRINTLRHVFGIDKYKRILENASIVLGKIREEKRIKEALILNIENEKQELILKENELNDKKTKLIIFEQDFILKTNFSEIARKDIEDVSKKIEEKDKFQQEIEKTQMMISTKNNQLSDNKKMVVQLKNQIGDLTNILFDESKIVIYEDELKRLKEKKYLLNEENTNLVSNITSLFAKNQDSISLKQKISHLEVCPTCLQDVDSVYKSNVVNKLDSDMSENIHKIQELEISKQKVSTELNNMEYSIFLKEKEIQDLKLLKVKIQGINEKQKYLDTLEKQNNSILQDINLLNSHTNSLKNSVFELSKYENIFREKQQALQNCLKEEKMAEIKLAEIKREIAVFSSHINELNIKISRTHEILNQLNYLSNLEDWLSKKFMSIVSLIEKNVLVKLKTEFSQFFSEWFSMLVSDNFNVRLDEEFTPIIEHQDYEIDYNYLSGGERTAIALAYRLALNQVINSVLSKIKTRDLVILDEPTDGFSSTQLDKMREVLEQLNVAQLIIVSHEQKIEGFVDNVIRFKKENGLSKMEDK
jgi:exonuclease SbcC